MKPVLVDSSVWIEYFRKGKETERLEFLIDENLVVINDLILTELIPFLLLKNDNRLAGLLEDVKRVDLQINWEEIREYQLMFLRAGINGVGIPDIIVAQNAIQNAIPIFSHDNHFHRMKEVVNLVLFD